MWSGDRFYRFAGSPKAEDLRIWDEETSQKLRNVQGDPLFGREAVQLPLLEEARKIVLEEIIKKGLCHD